MKALPALCQGEEAVTDRVCEELSFHRLSSVYSSQDDMQFIPGVFYKPFSLILRCKSPQAMARLSVSQPLEQHSIQTDRRTQTGRRRTMQAIV